MILKLRESMSIPTRRGSTSSWRLPLCQGQWRLWSPQVGLSGVKLLGVGSLQPTTGILIRKALNHKKKKAIPPLARNQYINNSPGVYPVFAPNEFPQDFGKIFRKCLLKNSFLYWRECEYRPCMHLRKDYFPQFFFPACIGFVPGGYTLDPDASKQCSSVRTAV